MTSPNWIKIRARAARDSELSHAAFRLLCCLVDHICTQNLTPDDEFPLPWSRVSTWLHLAKDQSYNAINELVGAGFLVHRGRRECPATVVFSFLPSWRENPPTSWRENPPTSWRKKSPHHISTLLRRKKGEEEGRNSSAPGGLNGAPEKGKIEAGPRPAENGRRRHVSELVAAMRESIAQEENGAGLRPGRRKR